MPKKDTAILKYLSETAWAMEPAVLNNMTAIVLRHANGMKPADAEIARIVAERSDNNNSAAFEKYQVVGNAAVIPIHGVIVKYANMVNGTSQPQGTSCEAIEANLNEALADRKVKKIVLHIESPGGATRGITELADALYAANKQKPVIAYADGMAASAAYYLGSQARRFYAGRGAEIGSIGVYAVLYDVSKLYENHGYKAILISSGQFKGVGAEGVPIEDEKLGGLRNTIMSIYENFVADVARGRAAEISDIEPLADGRTLLARQAQAAGLIDGIMTFDDVLQIEVTADGLTPAAAAAGNNNGQGDTDMADAKNKDISAARLDEIKAQAAAEAVAKNNERVQAVAKVLAGYPDLLARAVADANCDTTAATALLVPKLQAELKQTQEKLAEANKRLEAIASGGGRAIDRKPTDTDGEPPDSETKKTETDTAEAFVAEIKRLRATGLDEPAALEQAIANMPGAHVAWVDAGCPEG